MKIKALLIASALAITLTGCETAMELQKTSTTGLNTSCEQIYSTFRAYQNDRNSIAAYKELAGMTGASIPGVTPENVSRYYTQIKNTANIALVAKGCQPLT